jgi:hypothetical protein
LERLREDFNSRCLAGLALKAIAEATEKQQADTNPFGLVQQ